jgi:Concanavalin A-like lectin/glucanases superfamily
MTPSPLSVPERYFQMSTHLQWISAAAIALAILQSPSLHAQADFASAVTSTKPIAYFRLGATSGKGEVGTTTYHSTGGVTVGSPGATIAGSSNHFAKFDGTSGSILTTQKGGVGVSASIMAWVNLEALPSKTGHIVYVAGESEYGNDLDLQFETDNVLRFFTASGGSLPYTPPVDSLVNQWHMIVVTLDTASHTRAIYWDGKLVAHDTGGGEAGKKSPFSIGASTVFAGRWFKGGIQEVALWDRAIKASDVTAIYTASTATASAAPAAGSTGNAATPTTGPFATKATVEVEDAGGPVKLKREEQIAYMFLSSIEVIEHNCQLTLQHTCTMAQMLSGSYPAGSHIESLKFDPNKTDPNYTYTVAAGGMAWEAHANAKKPGLDGWCFMSRNVGTTTVTYSPTGKSGWTDKEIGNRGMSGDSFATQ